MEQSCKYILAQLKVAGTRKKKNLIIFTTNNSFMLLNFLWSEGFSFFFLTDIILFGLWLFGPWIIFFWAVIKGGLESTISKNCFTTLLVISIFINAFCVYSSIPIPIIAIPEVLVTDLSESPVCLPIKEEVILRDDNTKNLKYFIRIIIF